MTTTIFWLVIASASAAVLRNMHIAAEHNVAGEQKVDGKWVKTMHADHYFFFMTYFCYMLGALFIIVATYFVAAFSLDFTGYAVKCGINTGLQLLLHSM